MNPAKSKVLLCSISPQANFSGIHFTLYGQPLLIVSDLKYLGVFLSQNLTFDFNADQVCTKAKKVLGSLFSACSGLTREYLHYLYILAKIQPILLYALPVSCPSSKRSWLALERVNRYACRLLLNDYSSPYRTLLQSTRIRSLQEVCVQRQLKLCYKYVYKLRNFPVEFPVCQNVMYNLRDRRHNFQSPLPSAARFSSLPVLLHSKFGTVWMVLLSI